MEGRHSLESNPLEGELSKAKEPGSLNLKDLPYQLGEYQGLNNLPDEFDLRTSPGKDMRADYKALQLKEIEKIESGEKKLETASEAGNYGEMKMDQKIEAEGFERISKERVTSIKDPGHQGIDGVYKNSSPPPQYVIGEAKYGDSKLSYTLDGKQMSDSWVFGSRLDAAVGKEKADEIRMERVLYPENVEKKVYHIGLDGSAYSYRVDADANKI